MSLHSDFFCFTVGCYDDVYTCCGVDNAAAGESVDHGVSVEVFHTDFSHAKLFCHKLDFCDELADGVGVDSVVEFASVGYSLKRVVSFLTGFVDSALSDVDKLGHACLRIGFGHVCYHCVEFALESVDFSNDFVVGGAIGSVDFIFLFSCDSFGKVCLDSFFESVEALVEFLLIVGAEALLVERFDFRSKSLYLGGEGFTLEVVFHVRTFLGDIGEHVGNRITGEVESFGQTLVGSFVGGLALL